MEVKEIILEESREKLLQMKMLFEELHLQLALGKAEAMERLEEEKKNLTSFIAAQRVNLEKVEALAQKQKTELKEKFEALEASLLKAVPAVKEAYDDYKKLLLSNIYDLEYCIKTYYGILDKSVRKSLDSFKLKLESFRVHLALSDYDNHEQADQRRQELRVKIDVLIQRLERETVSREKLKSFAEEMSASYEHLKKGFSELFA